MQGFTCLAAELEGRRVMGVLSVMTWNVENLFAPNDGDLQRRYRSKLEYLAGIISSEDADVVALQEVGGNRPLDDLRDEVGSETYPFGVVSDHPDGRGIRVALISKHELADVGEIVEFPATALIDVPDRDGRPLWRMSRGVLHAVIDHSDGAVRVLTAHLKSKLITYPDGGFEPANEDERARETGLATLRRTAEAVALRVELNKFMSRPDAPPTILAGDLNDEPHAATTMLLLGPEDRDPTRPSEHEEVVLFNLAKYLPDGQAYTRVYEGRRELIDHILVSVQLAKANIDIHTRVKDVPDLTQPVRMFSASPMPDHAPLTARITLS